MIDSVGSARSNLLYIINVSLFFKQTDKFNI